MRILVIEDEASLRDALAAQLRREHYAVDVAADGEEGQYIGLEFDIDLAIVDLGLPGMSGIEVIKHWRQAGRRFPVLILTARGRWQDKVEGLDAGADDYLVKPFHTEELLARAKALLRRSAGWAHAVIDFGQFCINTTAQTVEREGRTVELTGYEYRVLEYLALHSGEVVSKTILTEHIYDQDFDRDSNVIEVFIGRLRRKLDPDGDRPFIETLRGRGYRFCLQAIEPAGADAGPAAP